MTYDTIPLNILHIYATITERENFTQPEMAYDILNPFFLMELSLFFNPYPAE